MTVLSIRLRHIESAPPSAHCYASLFARLARIIRPTQTGHCYAEFTSLSDTGQLQIAGLGRLQLMIWG